MISSFLLYYVKLACNYEVNLNINLIGYYQYLQKTK